MGCNFGRAILKLDSIPLTTAAPTSLNPKLIKSFTRRTSGHCLGTFQTAKLCFGYTPLQTVVSLTTTPQLSSLSLSQIKDRTWEMSRIVTVGLTTLPPSMSRLCRQYGILNMSQSTACYGNSFTFNFLRYYVTSFS
jgi:hypothetical protein